jgi:hypothetical protein
LAGLEHIPKGGMFMKGTLSMMLPAGILPVMIILGVAEKVDGAMPKVQVIIAPVQQCKAMVRLLLRLRAPRP